MKQNASSNHRQKVLPTDLPEVFVGVMHERFGPGELDRNPLEDLDEECGEVELQTKSIPSLGYLPGRTR